MAGGSFKVYDRKKEFVASCKFAEDAAILAGINGDGYAVKYQHGVTLWREGQEAFSAATSYDGAAKVMWERRREYFAKRYPDTAIRRA